MISKHFIFTIYVIFNQLLTHSPYFSLGSPHNFYRRNYYKNNRLLTLLLYIVNQLLFYFLKTKTLSKICAPYKSGALQLLIDFG